MRPIDLFFSPFAYIWPHERLEGAVREVLRTSDRDIHVLRCRGVSWNVCMVKHAVGAGERTLGADLCERCQATAQIRLSEAEVSFLEDLRNPTEDECIRLSNELEFREIIARAARHDYVLVNKKSIQDLSTDDELEISAIQEVLLSLLPRLWKFLNDLRPSRVFYYNDVYAINRLVKALADRLSIPTVNLHLSLSPRRMWDHFLAVNSREDLLDLQNIAFNAPVLNPKQCKMVAKVIKFQERGRSPFLYSAPRRALAARRPSVSLSNTSKRKKILLVLSSHDEMHALKTLLPSALESGVFEQEETLGWFLSAARARPDLDFVVRPHPREFPNRRQDGTTSQATRLVVQSKTSPRNVTFDWPSLQTPLYSLVRESSAVVFTWSSAGLESLLLGKHAATTTPRDLVWCPNGFFEHISSRNEMVSFVDFATTSEVSFESRLTALRWYSWFINNMDHSFHPLPYRFSPARLTHGIVGRGWGSNIGRVIPMLRRLEILLSRRHLEPIPHSWKMDDCGVQAPSAAERKLLRLLQS